MSYRDRILRRAAAGLLDPKTLAPVRWRIVYRLPVTGVEAVEFVVAHTVEEAIVKVTLEHENIEVVSWDSAKGRTS